MKRNLKTVMASIIIAIAVLTLPSYVKADDGGATSSNENPTVKTSVDGGNKAIKVELTNIVLDDTHEYQYGVSLAKATQPTNWYTLTSVESNSASLIVTPDKEDMSTALRTSENVCVFVKDVTDNNNIVINGVKVSVKMDLAEALSLSTLSFKFYESSDSNSEIVHDILYLNMIYNQQDFNKYKYAVQKIDDVNIIKKYLEAKDNNTDKMSAVQNLLSKEVTSNLGWKQFYGESDSKGSCTSDYERCYDYRWQYNESKNANFYNLTKYEGLYLIWGQVSFEEGRSIYGYTLYDTFPTGYKLAEQVTDKSTDDSTGTENNDGVTGNEDANKGTTTSETKNSQTGSETTTSGQTDTNIGNIQTVTPKTDPEEDKTTASTGKLPYTGMGIGIIAFIAIVFAIGTFAYCKYFRLKDI